MNLLIYQITLSSYFLPETVEALWRSFCIKIRKGLWVSLGPWDCNTDELMIWLWFWPEDGWFLNWTADPSTDVCGSGMRYNFYLEQIRNHDWDVSWPPSESLSWSPPISSLNTHILQEAHLNLVGEGEGIIHNQESCDHSSLYRHPLHPSTGLS